MRMNDERRVATRRRSPRPRADCIIRWRSTWNIVGARRATAFATSERRYAKGGHHIDADLELPDMRTPRAGECHDVPVRVRPAVTAAIGSCFRIHNNREPERPGACTP